MEEVIKKIGAAKILTIAAIGIGLMFFFGYIMMRANQPEMGLIFSQIEQSDAARIIDKLQTMGVPNEVKGDGTQIYVPADQIPRLRMELAQDGMPSGGTGYEIFDKQDAFGTTNALLNINKLRALEGELAKSIKTIGSIQGARVHLVIPKRELFNENKLEPSASVLVKMRGPLNLSAMQVQSIRYLVASAVPGLLLDQVSIIDDKGNLLAKGKENSEKKDSSVIHQDMQQEYEQKLSRSLESMLDKTLGLNKSRVEVAVEMDFDQVSTVSVQYDPEGQVIKNQTTNEEGSHSNESLGSSGDGVSIQNVLPTDSQNSGSQSKNQTTNTEENINYEISNTTKNYTKEIGTVKRISIAVMVDGSYKKKDDGSQEYAPRTQEELDKLKELVKAASGFKEDRGDTITLINLKFTESIQENIPADPEKPFFGLNINKIIELGITALVILIGLLTVIKPIITGLLGVNKKGNFRNYNLSTEQIAALNAQSTTPGGFNSSTSPQQQTITTNQFNTGSQSNSGNNNISEQKNSSGMTVRKRDSGIELEESMINIDQIEGLVKQSSIKKIGELVDRHPDEAVSVIRSWMHMD